MSDNRSCLPPEPHSRTAIGIQSRLWWSTGDGRTGAAVRDARTDAGFVPPVLADERTSGVLDPRTPDLGRNL
jgi:hypothetical protein